MSWRRTLAALLMRVARWLLPASRADWADAMAAELAWLDEAALLPWAFGYVLANLNERVSTMLKLTPSRAARLNIGISIAFAAAMAVVAAVMKHSPGVWLLLTPLMALWMVPFGYLSAIESAGRRACRSQTKA